jgi:hypothetical protein
VIVVLICTVLDPSIAAACPTCKAAIASHDANAGDMVSGYMYSILFMLSMPFIIFGSLATYFYMLVRKARTAAAQAAATAAGAVSPASSLEAPPRETRWHGDSGAAKPAIA